MAKHLGGPAHPHGNAVTIPGVRRLQAEGHTASNMNGAGENLITLDSPHLGRESSQRNRRHYLAVKSRENIEHAQFKNSTNVI